MKKLVIKDICKGIAFLFILFAVNIQGMNNKFPEENAFLYSFTYVLSIGIYISVFTAWTVSIYNRIMQRHVRTYLMLIGANIILWVSIRGVKWGAFRYVTLGDRLLWYMFYIPMIMIPLLFFFTALSVGEEESYRPSKKWNLLFIPAILLILLVLTNDFHMLVFSGFDLSIHMYGMEYDYQIGYFIIVFFLITLIVLSIALIIKKFKHSTNSRKASRLPLLVLAAVILYNVLHIMKPVYGIGHYFMDVTIFSCVATIAFWEACIRTGLIHSNNRHKEFFRVSTTNAQILNHGGEAVYISENAKAIPRKTFETLKTSKNVEYGENSMLNMSPINGGYVLWSSDVSDIKGMIRELEDLNKELYEEANLLTAENEHKKEATKAKKLSELHSILLAEALPYTEKIKKNIVTTEDVTLDEMKDLLFETSIISTYLKRKVNLILTEQTEKCISTDEIQRAFLESFSLLRCYEKTCNINIVDNFDMSLNTAMYCYDLYQKIIEKVHYNFNIIYVTFRKNENRIAFSIDIETKEKIDKSYFKEFEANKFLSMDGRLEIEDNAGSYHFALTAITL